MVLMSHDEHIALLRQCADTCRATLFEHCLPEGGAHAERGHVQIMMDCITICKTAVDFMTRGSSMHGVVCASCAEICLQCAESCAELDDPVMKRCAEVCHRCADACVNVAAEHFHDHTHAA